MKHKLTVAAVMAALGGGAFAQSSVTVFGGVDVSVAHASGSISNLNSISSNGISASKIGFRGVEDLGGGLSANFWLESGLSPDTGIGQATNTNNQPSGEVPAGGLMFNRRSTVGLLGKWGELRLGRDLTPNYWNVFLADPWWHLGFGTAQTVSGSVPGGATWYRASNSIAYRTPSSMGNFFAHAMYYLGENGGVSSTAHDGDGVSVRVGYQTSKYTLSIGAQRTQRAAGDLTNTSALATYDAGFAKLTAGINRDTIDGAPGGKGWVVGAKVPIGLHEVRGSLSSYQMDSAGNPRTQKLALGYVHNLSKRTALYATGAYLSNSGGAARSLGGAATAKDDSSTGVQFGISHSF